MKLVLALAIAILPIATAAKASATDWNAVAACESGGRWNLNTGNGFHGGLQFSLGTWYSHGGHGLPENNSREDQIRIAENVRATSGMGAWPVCGRRG